MSVRVVCHEYRSSTRKRNCTRDEGRPFEVGDLKPPQSRCRDHLHGEAVRDLRRTAFSSRCRPIASSPRRRLVDRELSPEPVGFDGLGRVPAREQIVHCLIPTGERKPRVGHREMKFAAMKFACFLSRQQTLCRVIAVASRIVHGGLHSPPMCFGAESPWMVA
jgi:hypothetical protein